MATVTPYYEDDHIVLYHGDCTHTAYSYFWTMADILITDPPYGVAYQSNMAQAGPSEPIEGDGDPDLRDAALFLWQTSMWWDKAAIRPALVFGHWRVPRPANTKHRLIWDKGASPGMGDLLLPWGPGDEEIYVLGDSRAFTGKRSSNILRANTLAPTSHARPDHPTPKPQGLMEQLIKATTGVIADPFAGSGTTLVAAKALGRRAIGVEKKEQYCDLIAGRLAQGSLFG